MYPTKYVVVKHLDNGMETPYIFPNFITHSDFARDVGYGSHVVSAGFCYIDKDLSFVAHGKSVSLKVASRPDEDSKLLTRWLTGGGNVF